MFTINHFLKPNVHSLPLVRNVTMFTTIVSQFLTSVRKQVSFGECGNPFVESGLVPPASTSEDPDVSSPPWQDSLRLIDLLHTWLYMTIVTVY